MRSPWRAALSRTSAGTLFQGAGRPSMRMGVSWLAAVIRGSSSCRDDPLVLEDATPVEEHLLAVDAGREPVSAAPGRGSQLRPGPRPVTPGLCGAAPQCAPPPPPRSA